MISNKTQLTLSFTLFIFSGFMACHAAEVKKPELTFQAYEFKANDGTTIASELGTYIVPENRTKPDSREIKVRFVRFKSTSDTPGAPIVYLAGGPGGSGIDTARGRRFPLFMAMREFGDVIALDQRGTGQSDTPPECKTDYNIPLHEPLNLDKSIPLMRKAADECAAYWQAQGVDLAGYNTLESARDINALRVALGVEKVSLWGISYGSHLALAALKTMQDNIDKVVITAIEGLEATVKLPVRTDAYFERLQAAINADEAAAAAYPNLVALMRRVHTKLDAEPITTEVTDSDGKNISVTIGKVEIQVLGSSMIADPAGAARLPAFYAMVDAGDMSVIAPLIYEHLRRDPLSFSAMTSAMDVMSGISKKRLALVRQQANESLLGDMLNFPMPHLINAFGLQQLDDSFRKPVNVTVPTLMLSSTLDGRTYPKGVDEAAFGPGIQTVVVHNGGHNVFMQAPEITDIIVKFMRGETMPNEVTLPLPKFLY